MMAIIWRDMKVSMNSLFGILMQFTTPIFMLLMFATAFSNNIGKIAIDDMKINYIEFFAPGLFGYMTFFILTLSFSFLRIDSRTGVLSIIALSKASLKSYFWGKYIVQLFLAFIKILVLILLTTILTGSIPNLTLMNSLLFLITLLVGVIIWYSIGMIGGIFIHRDDLREIVAMLITMPLTFASTMYYQINVIPKAIRWIAYINPLTYICNIFRGCYLNNLEPYLYNQLIILVGFAMIFVSISLYSLKKIKF